MTNVRVIPKSELEIKCSNYRCPVVVADDIFDGWVRMRGVVYRAPNGSLYCKDHTEPSDHEVEGEINLLAEGK